MDENLNCIKGGGCVLGFLYYVLTLTVYCLLLSTRGCQTQEKVVAANAKTFVVICDHR